MPNGEENAIDLEGFAPSWLEDGGGISGLSPMQAPFVEDTTDYYINPATELPVESETIDPQTGDDNSALPASGCLADAGDPPDTGTWILGSIDGTCQWIDTTTC